MLEFRHVAYNLITGEIMNANRGNHLKREVARTQRLNREFYHIGGQWRFCHDYGKKWEKEGLPVR